MNNLIENYEIILKYLKEPCEDLSSYHQIRKPKISNLELVAVNITAEYRSINTELHLLFHYIESIQQRLSEYFADFTDVFIVDSLPTTPI
jgi:hypothetical protein